MKALSHHVHSHEGKPWNELADTGARCASEFEMVIGTVCAPQPLRELASMDSRCAQWIFFRC